MQKERRSADSVLYEPAELCGQPVLGTGCLIDHATVPEGICCYDYLHMGTHCLITSERDSRYAEGSVLLSEPLTFGQDGTLDAGIIDHDKYMDELMVTPENIGEFFSAHAQTVSSTVPQLEIA